MQPENLKTIGERTMSEQEAKRLVVVIGPRGAGKTCILWRLKRGEYLGKKSQRTIGYQVDDELRDPQVIEIGGQEAWEELMEQLGWIQTASMIFFVMDSTQPSDLERYSRFITNHPEIERLIILANKVDKLTTSEYLEKRQYLKAHTKHRVIPCSAKTGRGFVDIEIVFTLVEERKKDEEEEKIEEQETTYSERELTAGKKQVEAILKEFEEAKER
jgi:GTPase SAR1 family protein